jgi:hypothetical protein
METTMKTQQDVLNIIQLTGKKSECVDGRDFSRLVEFFPASDWNILGFELIDGATAPEPKAWTVRNIIEQLKADVAFGFENALNKRGISAASMHATVKMWLWVLNDELELQADELYPQYGLPFFKAVAVKYGFPNPIGDDEGIEHKYAMYGDS